MGDSKGILRSQAFQALPGYPLAGIPELKRKLLAEGVDLIDLGAGDADLLPPEPALAAIRSAVSESAMSRYGFQLGLPAFRDAVAGWMQRRFGFDVDPKTQIAPLIGSKEGIAHLPLAFLNPGEMALVPDPGYQAYAGGVLLAKGIPHLMPLEAEHGDLAQFRGVSDDVLSRCKLLYLNYPNNPTTALASSEYLTDAVAFCREHQIVLVFDNAYSEIAFDGYRPPSIFEIDGAWDVAIEYHSFSKTYNMTGWRLGWATGNPDLIATLTKVKTFLDTGAFLGIQAAGVAALESWPDWVPQNVARFQARRDALVEGLHQIGWGVDPPKATMYLWAPVPTDEPSEVYTTRVLKETGVVLLPGAALGTAGEGYVRLALTQDPDRLREAARRIGDVS